MYTLVDFVTHVKGVEYILSILFIAGFLVLWEVMKPAPFRTVVATGREDLEHIQQRGRGDVLRTVGKLLAAPFIGLAYLAMLPIGFAAVLVAGTVNILLKGVSVVTGALGLNVSFDWRPMEAYFTGRKKHKSADSENK
ncbi:MAG TPA: hypothetical protein VN604_10295 [Nitrospirota bacterium]|nr:hypothetical protein [Nitrospirota bacterium]